MLDRCLINQRGAQDFSRRNITGAARRRVQYSVKRLVKRARKGGEKNREIGAGGREKVTIIPRSIMTG